MGVGRADGFGQDILNPSRRHHCAHGPPGNYASAFRGGFKQHHTRAEPSQHSMRYGGLGEVDPEQIFLGRLNSLADSLRNFLRLSGTEPNDGSSGIADHDQRGEREILASLDDFGYAVDGNNLVLELELSRIEPLRDCWDPLLSFLSALLDGRDHINVETSPSFARPHSRGLPYVVLAKVRPGATRTQLEL